LAPAALLPLGLNVGARAQQQGGATDMTFFVASVGSGDGADLGGLEGADRQSSARACGP
jgi:hypothetical protein